MIATNAQKNATVPETKLMVRFMQYFLEEDPLSPVTSPLGQPVQLVDRLFSA
jgi:hypothetical protein